MHQKYQNNFTENLLSIKNPLKSTHFNLLIFVSNTNTLLLFPNPIQNTI